MTPFPSLKTPLPYAHVAKQTHPHKFLAGGAGCGSILVMSILIQNRRTMRESLQKRHPDATIIDVTSRGPEPWVRFSPFYPHGGIPVPFSPGYESMSVEGIWQGLKVFEKADIDVKKLEISTMKGLKRTVRAFGKVLGHRKGVEGKELLPYGEARRLIYLPSYLWVLQNRLSDLCRALQEKSAQGEVILLDYETNCDLDDLSRPLSHAGLIQRFLAGCWPGDVGTSGGGPTA